MKTSQQIRQALIQIAERNNRPHYTLLVVRAVIDAIHSGSDHPLKDVVENEVVKDSIIMDTSIVGELQQFCARRGIREILIEKSNISSSSLEGYLSYERVITDDAWSKLKNSFNVTLKEFERRKLQSGKFRAMAEKYCGSQSVQGGAA